MLRVQRRRNGIILKTGNHKTADQGYVRRRATHRGNTKRLSFSKLALKKSCTQALNAAEYQLQKK